MLTVCTFLYKPNQAYWRGEPQRVRFTHRDVNVLAAMVRRHLRIPHRFVCITDDGAGISSKVERFPLWAHFKGQKRNYRRLRLLGDEVTSWIGGDAFLQLDLDTVITGDITPLITNAKRATIWQCPSEGRRGSALNPSLLYFRPGELSDIWRDFSSDPHGMAAKARQAGYTGTDQGVLGMYADRFDTWTDADGVLSYRDHIEARGLRNPPPDARLVGFYGNYSVPLMAADHAWIRHHWTDA